MTSTPQAENRKLRTYRDLLLAGGILVFLLIVSGGVLQITDAAAACGEGSLCIGGWASRLLFGLTLVILGGFTAAAIGAFYELHYRSQGLESRLRERLGALSRSKTMRLVVVSAAAVFVLLVSGTIVAGLQAAEACTAWPLCENSLSLPDSPAAWAHTAHRLIVLGTGLLVAWLAWRTWRTQRANTPLLVASTIVLVLFAAQALLGSRFASGHPVHLLVIHQATAVAVWAAAVSLAVIAVYSLPADDEEPAAGQNEASALQLVKDFLMLTKPIVVLLLLVTTYAGMVIGAQSWPSASLTFWTLLGGFLAAGGSGAIT